MVYSEEEIATKWLIADLRELAIFLKENCSRLIYSQNADLVETAAARLEAALADNKAKDN